MNFNRRQNRIASPGFHINVRYDDQTMARAHSNSNQAHEKLAVGTTHVENFDVKEAEILVTMKDSGMYHDGYTHCFSFANGFPQSAEAGKDADPSAVEEWVLSKVKYVGIATTEYKPSKAYSEQGHVAQVGGVVTLINESETTIKPGDKLALGLNLKLGRRVTRDKGIPRDKIRFCVKKAGHSDDLIAKALGGGSTDAGALQKLQNAQKLAVELSKMKKTKQNKNEYEALEKKLKDANDEQLKCLNVEPMKQFLRKYQELNERVIGKAASYARPGDRLEVVLQPRNPY